MTLPSLLEVPGHVDEPQIEDTSRCLPGVACLATGAGFHKWSRLRTLKSMRTALAKKLEYAEAFHHIWPTTSRAVGDYLREDAVPSK
jgi:hypothetical protein